LLLGIKELPATHRPLTEPIGKGGGGLPRGTLLDALAVQRLCPCGLRAVFLAQKSVFFLIIEKKNVILATFFEKNERLEWMFNRMIAN
jgi:hypothetical protein